MRRRMDASRLEAMARELAAHPGMWRQWPEGFADETELEERMESLRDGREPLFRVDGAAFQWRVDMFHRIVQPDGPVRAEVRCAW